MKLEPIGFNAFGAPVHLKTNRLAHHHVIGPSGSGKSKFLEQMMRGDLPARQGFCLIDPHGTLYDSVVEYCAYHVHTRDIILLDLSEPDHIVGFNFFVKDPKGDTSVQVDNLINATLHAWDAKNSDATPTLERTLRLIYTTVLDAGMTLPQITSLLDFNDKVTRDKLISMVQDDFIRKEWEELSNLPKAKDFREEMLSAKNRLFRFLTSKTIKRFLGMKGKTIDLTDAMNKQKTILVKLAPKKNQLSPENSRLFGSLLVNQFFQAALDREKDAFGRDPKPYYLYLDEFQNFVSIDLADMLDQVRKFGLFLVLSHQRFGQLDENFIDAVLTNCRIKTVFGGLPTESAERMAKEMFIGKLNPMKVKVSIYQTKHLYQYVRDKVYSEGESIGGSDSTSKGWASGTGRAKGVAEGVAEGMARGISRQSATASGSQSAALTGETFIPVGDEGGMFTPSMWFNSPELVSTSNNESSGLSEVETSGVAESEVESKVESRVRSYAESEFEMENGSQSRSDNWSKNTAVADVPTLIPVPIQELSSINYFTIEEQLLEMTQALKLQTQRHCFIELPNQQTQPLLVPYVDKKMINTSSLKKYLKIVAAKNGAVTPQEADQIIFQDEQDLLQLKGASQPSSSNSSTDTTQQPPPVPLLEDDNLEPRTKSKKTIFDRLKENNPDVVLDN